MLDAFCGLEYNNLVCKKKPNQYQVEGIKILFNRFVMKKYLRLALIVVCLLVLAWLRFFSSENT